MRTVCQHQELLKRPHQPTRREHIIISHKTGVETCQEIDAINGKSDAIKSTQ